MLPIAPASFAVLAATLALSPAAPQIAHPTPDTHAHHVPTAPARQQAERTGPGIADAPRAGDYAGQPVPRTRGRFIVHCAPAFRDAIDPIVTPGVHGLSHLHDFYGPAALPRAPRISDALASRGHHTCSTRADRSAYWAPVLYRGTTPVAPQRLQAYYTVTDLTQPTPRGLAAVAGHMHASRADGVRVRWLCAGTGHDRAMGTAEACAPGEYLMAAVSFPGCWNARHLTSAGSHSYHSHLAYADERGRCPRDHPVHIPQLDMFLQWDCTVVCQPGGQYSLSAGRTGGLHADAIFNWRQARLRHLIENCQARDCGLLGTEP